MIDWKGFWAKVRRVIETLVSPWRYSNAEMLEEVRIAARDASAAKAAVSRLRAELRGEAEPSEEVAQYRKVMPGPTSKPIPQAGEATYRRGQSMTRYMDGR